MTKEQQDLFAEDHKVIGELFDRLDNIPEEEIEENWSSVLTSLIHLFKSELKRQKIEIDTDLVVPKLVGVLSHYFGGRSVYLPKGDKIKEALRDYEIYDNYNGKNIDSLMKKYNLTASQIYKICRKQRAIIRKRYQNELPF